MIEVLQETQVDKYVERMHKYKEFHENLIMEREKEIEKLKQEMDKLLKENLSKDEIIYSQQKLIDDFEGRIIEYEVKSWEQFLNDSERNMKHEYAESWDDILVKGKSRVLWTLKLDKKMMERLKYPVVHKDKDEDEDEDEDEDKE